MKLKNVAILSLTLSFPVVAHAQNAVVDTEFMEILDSLRFSLSGVSGPDIEGQESFVLTNKRNIQKELAEFGIVDVDYDGSTDKHISLTDEEEVTLGSLRQSHGLVRAVTSGLPGTFEWSKADQVNETNLEAGDVIATFLNGDTFDQALDHTVIVGRVEGNGVWVLDQNWIKQDRSNGGYIRLHFIDNTGDGMENLNNYYHVSY
ncbi:BPSL0067 family protein [Gynuella sunshinyii]|uniref:Peptidase C51 domain-containing protein n=1 Tax=Gynuella sunshinyii YC6258 TaxID=1445510 RepID=A0A0C5UZ03_9GAMM|nr:BPSL0067 family protein [Gynuella sunshinyii]AJQ92565.1 hypothetical Protein YC6258_00515 [Gynuella sunshinyii YC6258]